VVILASRWTRDHLMRRGDIYEVDLEPTIGREQRGFRPVMVLSNASFNKYGAPIVAPITTGGDFARMAGFAVSLMNTGTETTGVVRCDQIRALDMQARGARRVESAPDYVVAAVLAKVSVLFE
jgi:mRNA interferase ChpB